MAVPVARVHLAMAHAALPGLLPTPPELKMAPPSAAAVTLPNLSPPKPGRAHAVDRWDACKNLLNKSSSSKPTGRADAAERWDARKTTARSSSGQSSPDGNKSSSASLRERWDVNKKSVTTPSSSSSSSSGRKWDSNKRPVSCGSSSAERWDAHKKPRPQQADEVVDVDDYDDGGSSTGSNDMEVDDKLMGLYAASGLLAAPEPCTLPVPSFLVLPRFVVG